MSRSCRGAASVGVGPGASDFFARLGGSSRSDQREGFSIEALALHWSVREELLARLYAALEDPRVGWIDQDYVVDFWSENPDTEDPTANERQDRSRKFRAALDRLGIMARRGEIDAAERTRRELAVHALRDRARGHAVSWAEWKTELAALIAPPSVSQRDSVTVTPRSDQHISKTGNSVDNAAAGARGESQGLSGGQAARAAIDPQAIAELWLKSEGKQLVVARLLVTPTLAETTIERWARDLGDDRCALADILRGLSTTPHGGARFTELVRDRIAAARELQDGPLLAMGPAGRIPAAVPLPAAERDSTVETEQTRKVRHG